MIQVAYETLEFTRALQKIVRELRIRDLTALLQGWLKDPGNPNISR